MFTVEFEPLIPAVKRLPTYTVYRMTTVINSVLLVVKSHNLTRTFVGNL